MCRLQRVAASRIVSPRVLACCTVSRRVALRLQRVVYVCVASGRNAVHRTCRTTTSASSASTAATIAAVFASTVQLTSAACAHAPHGTSYALVGPRQYVEYPLSPQAVPRVPFVTPGSTWSTPCGPPSSTSSTVCVPKVAPRPSSMCSRGDRCAHVPDMAAVPAWRWRSRAESRRCSVTPLVGLFLSPNIYLHRLRLRL
jgi:hypothetical protein